MSEFLPCPTCGKYPTADASGVACETCGFWTSLGETYTETLDNWNYFVKAFNKYSVPCENYLKFKFPIGTDLCQLSWLLDGMQGTLAKGIELIVLNEGGKQG